MSDQVRCVWKDGAFHPKPEQAHRAGQIFREGQDYFLTVSVAHRAKARNMYHARIRELWHSLSEDDEKKFPSPSALRQFALISTGWWTLEEVRMPSPEAAERFAAYVQGLGQLKATEIDGNMVRVFTARSQSGPGMPDDDDWKRSIDDVIAFLEERLGVTNGRI